MMRVYLVHHAEAVGPEVDPQRPLSARGRDHAERVGEEMRRRGAAPAVIWHSGKLRARQTAEAVWRRAAPFAEFRMMRGLRPDDPPNIIAIALAGESRDVAVVGHRPNLWSLLARLAGAAAAPMPLHGVVALDARDDGLAWVEVWRWDGGQR
jgi:phosphohistidine phosphatase